MELKTYFEQKGHADPWVNTHWKTFFITPSLCFAHRISDYTEETYNYGMHFHDYYELNIIISGEIRFVCDKKSFLPKHLNIMFFPPHIIHGSMLNAPEVHYERYKIYFHEDALDEYHCRPMIEQLIHSLMRGYIFALSTEDNEWLKQVLSMLDQSLLKQENDADRILSVSYVLQLFALLSHVR